MDAEVQACIEHGQHEPAQLLSQAIRCGITRLAMMEIPEALRREALVMIRDAAGHYIEQIDND